MHFFHPAHRMELVEVIRGEQTSEQTVATLVDLAGRLGKTPIVVRDCPGFLTTRVLFPYLSQALQLLQEGTAMDAIDAAAVGFGMATGPIALLDFVGLDTALAISRVMAEGYPRPGERDPLLADLVEQSRLGQKSGTGFRKHDVTGRRAVSDPSLVPILQRHRSSRGPARTLKSLTDSSCRCWSRPSARLDEGIVNDSADMSISVCFWAWVFPRFAVDFCLGATRKAQASS